MLNGCRYCTPTYCGYDDLEEKFWNNLTRNPPIYGAGVSGTLTDADQQLWDLNNLHINLFQVRNGA